MGKECYCDFCRKSVAVDTNLQAVKVGDTDIGDACFNCASTLAGQMKKNIAETQKVFQQAMQPQAPAAPAPAAPPEQKPAPANPAAPPAPQKPGETNA